MHWLMTRRRVLAAFLSVGLAAACGGGGGGSEPPPEEPLGRAADYWAGAPDSLWLFDGHDNADAGARYRNRAATAESLARFGRTLVRFDHTRPFNQPFGPGIVYRSHLAAEGIRTYLDEDPARLERSYVELPAQLRRETYRAYEATEAIAGGTLTLRVDVTIAGNERITVPAGTFARALKTMHRFTLTRSLGGAPQTTVVDLTLWYAKGLGVIRQVLDDPGVIPPVASYVEELAGIVVPGTRAGVIADLPLLEGLAPAGATLATGSPGIASDGAGFMVAARALDAAGGGRIVATYVDARGRALWRKTVIDDLGTGVSAYGPIAVTYDGTQFWIAARSENADPPGTVLQRVSSAGELREAAAGRRIGGEWPALASNGESVLLVTSRNLGAPDWRWGRFATLFQRDGGVLRAEQMLAAGVSAGAAAAAGRSYLVTLDNDDIRAIRIDPTGALLDAARPLAVSTAPARQWHSTVSARGGDFIAAWLDPRSYGDRLTPVFDVYGARVTADGRLLDGPPDSGGVALQIAGSERHGLGIADGAAGTLISWTVGSYNAGPVQPAGIFARHFAAGATFTVTDPHAKGLLIQPLTAQDANVRLLAPAAAASRDGFAVAWVRQEQSAGRTQSIRGALVFPPLNMP